MVMKEILKVVIAILIVIVAWKILKGIVGLLIGVAVAGLLIYGGMKLLEGPKS
jgi:predicted PurR-regulated permease PerM